MATVTRWWALTLIACSLLAGCGLTQTVTDGTVSITKSIFYKKIKTLHLDFTPRTAINADGAQTPLATMVRLYQLRDRKAVDAADYQTLRLSLKAHPMAFLRRSMAAWKRKGGLEPFEQKHLEEQRRVALWRSPFLVMVGLVQRIVGTPKAAWHKAPGGGGATESGILPLFKSQPKKQVNL